MPSTLSLAVILVWATSSTHSTGQACLCSAPLRAALQVNCSSANLVELLHLPPDTTELNVQDNQLTSVSPGLFDKLVGLKRVSLSGNPFHCDCKIQYLRNWLLVNKAIVFEEPTCASPSSVAQKAVTELSDDFFSSCAPPSCTNGTFNAIVAGMLCCLVVLILWSLRLARTSTFILYIDERHSGFEADSLRSLKPKHRKSCNPDSALNFSTTSLDCMEDLENPLLNMELLPQVLDVLHKQHNIKLKAT